MGTSLVSSNPPLDTTLTKSGQAADAKAVGDALTLKKITKTLAVGQYSIVFSHIQKTLKWHYSMFALMHYLCHKSIMEAR